MYQEFVGDDNDELWVTALIGHTYNGQMPIKVSSSGGWREEEVDKKLASSSTQKHVWHVLFLIISSSFNTGLDDSLPKSSKSAHLRSGNLLQNFGRQIFSQ